MPAGFVYILECSNSTYYTGSTINLERRLTEHVNGEGANYTKKYPPIRLLYVEEYDRIDEAFYREKQIQRWSHEKKRALIEGNIKELQLLAQCRNITHHENYYLNAQKK